MSDEFEQFENEDEPTPPPAKKATAKKAAARKPAKKTAKAAPKQVAAEPKRDVSAEQAAHEARAAEATAEPDDDGIERVPVIVTKGDGADAVTFTTTIPRDQGEWDGRVLYLSSIGRVQDAYALLLGKEEFERFLDTITPRQKELVPLLGGAVSKALGIAEGN